jgi:6-phosphogluconate dehydrogenase (decarboxylating)
MIGLGRMGANMARRLLAGGHQCVVFDRSPKAPGRASITAVGVLCTPTNRTAHLGGLRDLCGEIVISVRLRFSVSPVEPFPPQPP